VKAIADLLQALPGHHRRKAAIEDERGLGTAAGDIDRQHGVIGTLLGPCRSQADSRSRPAHGHQLFTGGQSDVLAIAGLRSDLPIFGAAELLAIVHRVDLVVERARVARARCADSDLARRQLPDRAEGIGMRPGEGTPVWVGVVPAVAVLSLLDGVELVCAPPELCTIPERGSGVEASLGEEVEPSWPSTELCIIPDVEPEEETAAEADEFVADVEPVDDGLAADSDDELEADDDESDDELAELESVGSANATPGVVATAPPTPSATARAPTRPMYLAYAVVIWLDSARRAVSAV